MEDIEALQNKLTKDEDIVEEEMRIAGGVAENLGRDLDMLEECLKAVGNAAHPRLSGLASRVRGELQKVLQNNPWQNFKRFGGSPTEAMNAVERVLHDRTRLRREVDTINTNMLRLQRNALQATADLRTAEELLKAADSELRDTKTDLKAALGAVEDAEARVLVAEHSEDDKLALLRGNIKRLGTLLSSRERDCYKFRKKWRN
jgi:hypothetical protein